MWKEKAALGFLNFYSDSSRHLCFVFSKGFFLLSESLCCSFRNCLPNLFYF